MKNYTINEIMEISKTCGIEEWIHKFLTTTGKNIDLSQGLKKAKRYWIRPVEINFDNLERCCGPEKIWSFMLNLKFGVKRQTI